MSYRDYLKSDSWKTTKWLIKKNAKSQGKKKCQFCGSKKRLNVHHKTYKNIGMEQIDDLVLLCQPCHFTWHRVKYKETLTTEVASKIRILMLDGVAVVAAIAIACDQKAYLANRRFIKKVKRANNAQPFAKSVRH